MGSGHWDAKSYATTSSTNASLGRSAFHYSDSVRRGLASGVAPDLDPLKVAGAASAVAGKNIRESRDSPDHPNSVPIIVAFDVTGSMQSVPVTLQKKLPQLMETIVAKTGLTDAQILYMAIGDAYSDRYPLQIAHFESDNRADEHLGKIILEGGGGGSSQESYQLAMYAAARKTATDAWEKRGKKGYLITIGDEMAYPAAATREIEKVFGDKLEKDIPTADLAREVQERWEWFHIRPTNTADGKRADTHQHWQEMLGERVLRIDDETLICELVAGLIYVLEGNKTADAAVSSMGLSGKAADAVKNALVPISGGGVPAHVAAGSVPSAGGAAGGMKKI
jgi:hypothetical protein